MLYTLKCIKREVMSNKKENGFLPGWPPFHEFEKKMTNSLKKTGEKLRIDFKKDMIGLLAEAQKPINLEIKTIKDSLINHIVETKKNFADTKKNFADTKKNFADTKKNFADTKKNFLNLNNKMTGIEKHLTNHVTNTNKKIDNLTNRANKTDKKIDNLTNRADKTDKKIDNLSVKVDKILKKIS